MFIKRMVRWFVIKPLEWLIKKRLQRGLYVWVEKNPEEILVHEDDDYKYFQIGKHLFKRPKKKED